MLGRIGIRRIALLCSILPAFGASNAALVASLAGAATVDKSKPVASLQWLADGAVLRIAANSKVVVILLNGHRFELGGNAQARIGPTELWNTSGPVRELAPLPPMPKVAPLQLSSDAAAAARFRGAGNIKDLCPRVAALPGGGKLSFHGVEGASAYQIVLEDAGGDAVAQQQTSATEIAVTLQPGSHYSWRVRAIGPAGVIAEEQAGFVTLSSDQAGARTAFANAVGVNSALLAEVDFATGLLCEAVDEFSAALQANREDVAIRSGLERARAALAGK